MFFSLKKTPLTQSYHLRSCWCVGNLLTTVLSATTKASIPHGDFSILYSLRPLMTRTYVKLKRIEKLKCSGNEMYCELIKCTILY